MFEIPKKRPTRIIEAEVIKTTRVNRPKNEEVNVRKNIPLVLIRNQTKEEQSVCIEIARAIAEAVIPDVEILESTFRNDIARKIRNLRKHYIKRKTALKSNNAGEKRIIVFPSKETVMHGRDLDNVLHKIKIEIDELKRSKNLVNINDRIPWLKEFKTLNRNNSIKGGSSIVSKDLATRILTNCNLTYDNCFFDLPKVNNPQYNKAVNSLNLLLSGLNDKGEKKYFSDLEEVTARLFNNDFEYVRSANEVYHKLTSELENVIRKLSVQVCSEELKRDFDSKFCVLREKNLSNEKANKIGNRCETSAKADFILNNGGCSYQESIKFLENHKKNTNDLSVRDSIDIIINIIKFDINTELSELKKQKDRGELGFQHQQKTPLEEYKDIFLRMMNYSINDHRLEHEDKDRITRYVVQKIIKERNLDTSLLKRNRKFYDSIREYNRRILATSTDEKKDKFVATWVKVGIPVVSLCLGPTLGTVPIVLWSATCASTMIAGFIRRKFFNRLGAEYFKKREKIDAAIYARDNLPNPPKFNIKLEELNIGKPVDTDGCCASDSDSGDGAE